MLYKHEYEPSEALSALQKSKDNKKFPVQSTANGLRSIYHPLIIFSIMGFLLSVNLNREPAQSEQQFS